MGAHDCLLKLAKAYKALEYLIYVGLFLSCLAATTQILWKMVLLVVAIRGESKLRRCASLLTQISAVAIELTRDTSSIHHIIHPWPSSSIEIIKNDKLNLKLQLISLRLAICVIAAGVYLLHEAYIVTGLCSHSLQLLKHGVLLLLETKLINQARLAWRKVSGAKWRFH